MTTDNSNTSAEPRDTASIFKTESSPIQRKLEEALAALEKARLKSSDIQCTIDFITNDRNSVEVIPGFGSTDTVISGHQLQGIFLITDGVIQEFNKIKQIVLKYAHHEEETKEILASIDDAIKIIDLGLKLARISAESEDVGSDRICLASMWIAGFFSVLQIADDRAKYLFSYLNQVCEHIEERLNPNPKAVNESSDTQNKPENNVDISPYEKGMIQRIHAVFYKLKTLVSKFFETELLTNPNSIRNEAEEIRLEIIELKSNISMDSEKALNYLGAIKLLDFLIRLIDSKFTFERSDSAGMLIMVEHARSLLRDAHADMIPDSGGALDHTVH